MVTPPIQPGCAAFDNNDTKLSQHRNFTQHRRQWRLSTLSNPGPNLTEVTCSHTSKLSGSVYDAKCLSGLNQDNTNGPVCERPSVSAQPVMLPQSQTQFCHSEFIPHLSDYT